MPTPINPISTPNPNLGRRSKPMSICEIDLLSVRSTMSRLANIFAMIALVTTYV